MSIDAPKYGTPLLALWQVFIGGANPPPLLLRWLGFAATMRPRMQPLPPCGATDYCGNLGLLPGD